MVMTKEQIKKHLIKKEEEGTIDWRKTYNQKQVNGKFKFCVNCNRSKWWYYHEILKDCFGMYRNKWLEKYEAGKFPKCYVPCPPFYDICNRGSGILCLCPQSEAKKHKDYEKCRKCFDKFGFTSDIE